MIPFDKLKIGAWYDGFLWANGKQKGVATCQWKGKVHQFLEPRSRKHLVYKDETLLGGFEPNVESKEPA